MIATIENATNDVTDMLHRIRELAVQAANDTNSSTDREYLQKEVDSLLNEINRVASQTVYNGAEVLDGSRSGQKIQVGSDANQKISFDVAAVDTDTLGLTGTDSADDAFDAGSAPGVIKSTLVTDANVTSAAALDPVVTLVAGTENASSVEGGDGIAGLSVLTADHAEAALTKITAAIEQVAGNRAEYGSLANRLEYTVSNLMNVAEFTTAARSRIEDADFAAESARLAKAQVLQQTGTAMLAQANAASQLAIQLIR
jgi:flagellin